MTYYQLRDAEKIFHSCVVCLNEVVHLRPSMYTTTAGYYTKEQAVRFQQWLRKIGIETRLIPYVKGRRYDRIKLNEEI